MKKIYFAKCSNTPSVTNAPKMFWGRKDLDPGSKTFSGALAIFFILFTLLGIFRAIFGFNSWWVAGVVIVIAVMQLFLITKALGGTPISVPWIGKWVAQHLPD